MVDVPNSALLAGLTLFSLAGYHALWSKFTSVGIFAPRLKREEASRGRIWCFLWASIFFLASIYWPLINLFGVQVRGEGEYDDFLRSVLDTKSIIGRLGLDELVLRALYLAVIPFCLENSLSRDKASPKAVALLYFALPLATGWLTLYQLMLHFTAGGSALHALWEENGLTAGQTVSPEFDLMYWGAHVFHGVVFALSLFVGLNGGSCFGFLGGSSKDEAEAKKGFRSAVFFHMCANILFFSGWLVLANHGIPDPFKSGEYILQPTLQGNKTIYAKLHDQIMITCTYCILVAQLYPCLRKIGFWWARLSSLSISVTFWYFFGLAHLINSRKGGHLVHPSWTALEGAPKTAGRVLDLAFLLATVNFTVLNTNINVFSIIGHLPKIQFKPFETCASNVRTNMAFHGLLSVVVTGFWTYANCAGLTIPIEAVRAAISHPPIHTVNVKYAVLTHKQDLYNALLTVAMSVIIYDMEEYLKKNFSGGLNLQSFSSLWIKLMWFSMVVSKVALHMQVIPPAHLPLGENSDLTAYTLACKASFVIFTALRMLGGTFFLYYVYQASKYFRTKYAKSA